MSPGVGLLLIIVSLVGVKALDIYVSRHRARCTDMVGMMVGMVGGMLTGLLVGEVLGFFTDMFWANLGGLLVGISLGGYLGRHGRLIGALDGAMAGVMGGMMGAMLGVMLQFSGEYAQVTAVVLTVLQFGGLVGVAYLVRRSLPVMAVVAPTPGGAAQPILPDYYSVLGIAPDATRRDVAAAYLRLTDPAAPMLSTERAQLTDEAFAVLCDATRRPRGWTDHGAAFRTTAEGQGDYPRQWPAGTAAAA
jgi:hypothetical protein